VSNGKVLITGTSSGIGRATALLFLDRGYDVFGLDIQPSTIVHGSYKHYECDVSKPETLPPIKGINYLINNAGTIEEDISIPVNLEGYVNVVNEYGWGNNCIKSILNIGSISGIVGLDTPLYAASQGGRISYTKNLAINFTNRFKKVPINILCFGAVMTGLEPKLYANDDMVQAVANENMLKKWITVEEAAEWTYFMSVVNQSMCGQSILVDNGEAANFNFIDCRGESD